MASYSGRGIYVFSLEVRICFAPVCDLKKDGPARPGRAKGSGRTGKANFVVGGIEAMMPTFSARHRSTVASSKFAVQDRHPRARVLRRPGAAAVECALLLPFLAFVFVIAVDFGRIIYYTITIDNCVHNGAIFASHTFDNQNQQWIGTNQYWQAPSGQISAVVDATLTDGANLNPALTANNVTVSSGKDADGNSITTVSISYTFQTITQLPGVPSNVTIVRSCQIRVAPATPS
jgi:Flp pilus assembly protein TadG